MAINDKSNDFLVSVLAQQRHLHEMENQSLSQQERERLWQRRVQSLTNALIQGGSPTDPTMPSPPNKSALGPSPMARSHSIAVGEPTQMADRSPSLPGNVGMSRKRSAPGAAPSTPNDASRSSNSLASSTVTDPSNDYAVGAAPKLQRTSSGRQLPQHLRLQRPPQFSRALEHTAPLSATSSNLATPFTQSPMTPYECTPPNSAFSTSSMGHFQRAQQLIPHNMDRHDSIGGPIYHQMTQMNISNQGPRHQAHIPAEHPHMAARQQLPETYELDPVNMTRKPGSEATSPPITIPNHHPEARFMRRMSNTGPRPHFIPTMAHHPYMVGDKKTSPTRLLAPRPSPDSLGSRSMSSSPLALSTFQQHARPINVEGVEKYQIARLDRPRVEKQKLFCDQCNKQPDGFRGAHELQRHRDAQHSRIRRVWVCVDGSEDGSMLSNCKNCQAMKTYPAYYNAAAHLRRMHFKPKPEVTQKGKASRAGSGGGDDPPIEILKKLWMKQVLEVDGRIIDESEIQEEGIEGDVSSEEEDIKEEHLDASHELDSEAIEAADRAIPHLSSTIGTIDTIGSYVDVSPEEANDFADFDYDCLDTTLLDDANDTATSGRSLQQSVCASVSSAGSNLLDAAALFTGELDFSELFPVAEFFPSA